MSKLQRLREIIDTQLRHITMSKGEKAEVRRRIADGETGKAPARRWGWAWGAGAVALAGLALVLVVLPIFRGAGSSAPDMATAEESSSASGSSASSSSSASAAVRDNSGLISGGSFTDAGGLTYEVYAQEMKGGVTPADGSFVITVSGGEISAETLEQRITLQPAVAFTLQADSEQHYLLKPDEAFDKGEVVTLSIEGEDGEARSWAFQTENTLRVVSTLPGRDTTGMPLNTGIEISFNRAISAGAEDAIGISPAAPGSVRYYGKTLAYVPAESLTPNTVYTVTVRAGLTADSGEALEEDYVFSFRTPKTNEDYDRFFYLSGELTETFLPGDSISIGVYASESEQAVNVNLYTVPDAETFLSLARDYYDSQHPILGAMGEAKISAAGLTPYSSFEAALESPEDYWWGPSYLMFPQLGEGWYCAEIIRGQDTIWKLIQISPVSVYYQSMNGESFFWINDTVSGAPVSGASVEVGAGNASASAVTGTDGTARVRFDPEDGSPFAALRVKSGNRVFADYVRLDSRDESSRAEDYYSYVYLDRALYQPTDTVHYWGILLPRHGAALPGSLDVMASLYGEPRKVGTVTVGANGVFTGTYSFENNVSGYVNLSFNAGDDTLCTTYYSVMEYTKPSYVMTAAFDKAYYRAGDEMTVNIHAEFFDGTPASGLQTAYSKDSDYGELTLDADGNASIVVSPGSDSNYDWEPYEQYFNVRVSGAEDVYVGAFAQAPYFRSDYMLTADLDDTGAVAIRSNAIRFDVYEQHMEDYYSYIDEMRGAPADVSGSITILRCYYEKVPTGSYYDAIRKVNVETYDYRYCEDVVENYDFATVNGSYSVPPLIDPDYSDNACYEMRIDYNAPDGEYFQKTLFLSRSVYPGSYYFGHYVQRTDSDSGLLALGETGTFGVFATEQITTGTTLFTAVTDHVVDYSVAKGSVYDLTYTEEMLPNVIVYGAYFDGKHVYAASSSYIRYDHSQRELAVTLSTEQESYKPGDEVKGSIRITHADGQGVSANYAIGVVDESLFALMEQNIDPADTIYSARYYADPLRYTSYEDKDATNTMAEGGGEGGADSARREFLDTVAFLTGETGADGLADFSFTLPDNLTSWRITAAAVTNDAYAGHDTCNVKVSIPYFINLVLNDRYTTGDDIALSARVYGADVGAAASYTVLVDGEKAAQSDGVVGGYTRFNLGQFPAGRYEITILADSGNFHDGIVRTISVVDSRHQITAVSTGSLSAPVQIDALRYPVTMLFSDGDRQLYTAALSRLLCTAGARLDQALSAPVAAEHLKKLDPDADLTVEDAPLQSYQDYQGALRLFPYADGDAVTTALGLVTGAAHVDTAAAADYLNSVLSDYDSTSTEVAAAYLGLAALRQPVLADLRTVAAQPDGFNLEDRILLADALAILGDDANALNLYDSLVLSHLERTDAWCWMEVGDFEDNYAATTCASMLASLLNRSEQDLLVRYLLENESHETLPSFALMTYVQRRSIPASAASFSCRYNGQVQTWSLSQRPIVVLEFTKDELERADFRVVSGQVNYTAVYVGGIENVQDNAGDKIRVETTFQPSTASFGELVTLHVKVSFSSDCPGELYTLDVVLPSGTRFGGFESSYENGTYFFSGEGSRLTFLLDRRPLFEDDPTAPLRGSFDLEIRARAVLDGRYVLEPVIVRGLNSSLVAVGQSGNVTVQ